jgi:hypothetical protein
VKLFHIIAFPSSTYTLEQIDYSQRERNELQYFFTQL